MNLAPLNNNNKFFSDNEYNYYVSQAREHLASLDTKIIFYKVNKAKSQIDDLYGEAYEEFESSEEDVIEIQSADRMSEIKEEIDRLRASLPSSNNHILH